MVSAAVAEVATICRQAGSAWLAVCALHERAEELGVHTSVWGGNGDDYDDAESVRASLDHALLPPGTTPTGGADYEPASVGTAIAGLYTPLDLGKLSHVVASVLDEQYWTNFTRDWLADRGPNFELCYAERYPVGKMRLLGAVGYSAHPHRLGLRNGELAHVRKFGVDNIRVIVNGEHASTIDSLAVSPPLHVAALLPNESWAELSDSNPVGPVDVTTQRSLIDDLLEQARSRGAKAAVLPELSVDASILRALESEWAEATDRPMLFAGSVHLVDGDRRVNRTKVLMPGDGAAWSHDKIIVFEDREGSREPIDPAEPFVTLGCGEHVRIATVICKDALDVDIARLLADLGVHLLAVPAMSDRLGDYANVANELIRRSQGATVVANNPRLWNGNDVEHALLGQPVKSVEGRTSERRSLAAPDLGVARLGNGWLP